MNNPAEPIKSNMYKFYIKEKVNGKALSSAEAVFEELKELANADQESLWVVYVNTKNEMIGKDMVSLGGIDYASVDIRILFRRILLNNAPAFLIVHNHPGNSPEPSREDKDLTNHIKEASKLLQLRLLDHVIIASKGYYSFQSNGNL